MKSDKKQPQLTTEGNDKLVDHWKEFQESLNDSLKLQTGEVSKNALYINGGILGTDWILVSQIHKTDNPHPLIILSALLCIIFFSINLCNYYTNILYIKKLQKSLLIEPSKRTKDYLIQKKYEWYNRGKVGIGFLKAKFYMTILASIAFIAGVAFQFNLLSVIIDCFTSLFNL